MVRAIAKLLCLPFYWAGQLAVMLKQPVAVPLLKTAFGISGDGAVGRTALFAIRNSQGPEAARAQAAEWMRSRPRAEVAALAGLLAVDAGDGPCAAEMLSRGRALGDEPLGLFELLEFILAAGDGRTPGAATELARRLEARSDLSSQASLMVRKHLLWTALEGRDFEEARGRANRLLEVEDVPEAEMVLWAIAKREGRSAEAQAHLARVSLKPALRVYYQIEANRAIGREEENGALLAQLRDLDAGLAERVEAIGPKGGAACG